MPRVGVFDSGVGGLSVLRELRALLPHDDLIYAADSGHLPYGTKTPQFIQERALVITRFLVEREEAALVVIACNTATAQAVDVVRQTFSVPIVGIEPAIKPAARATRSGVVGVLATPGTLHGERFASLVQRYGEHVEVVTQPCPDLVERVEAGDLAGAATTELLRRYTAPMLARGADTIALGCTHYPFLREALQDVVGDTVTLIDPAAAVAHQAARVLAERYPAGRDERTAPGRVRFLTSGNADAVRTIIARLWFEPVLTVDSLPV